MSFVYIKSTDDGGVITASTSQANSPVAVLVQGSDGFQQWHFDDDGFLVLASSSPELCLSVSSAPLQNGSQASLELKGANNYSQGWGYDSEKSQIYLLEDNNYLLDSGSGGPAGPIVFVSTSADTKWTFDVV